MNKRLFIIIQNTNDEQKHSTLNAVCLFGLIYLFLIAMAVLFFNVKKLIFVWYIITSLISFIFYWHDKNKAKNGEWRTSEETLHTIDMLGGWIGASFAQKFLNHKTSKGTFRTRFYLNILFHIVSASIAIFMMTSLLPRQ